MSKAGNKTVVVTAGGSGIGLGIAGAFLARGYNVHVCDISQDALDKAMDENPGLMRTRRCTVEHPFGTIKYLMGQIPILLRGMSKVQIEMDLYTLAYNFKRLINIEETGKIEKLIIAYNWKAR